MDDLRTTADLVHTILKENKRARNSDNYLYYCVIRIIGARSGIDIEQMSVPNFFLHMKEYNMPPLRRSDGPGRRSSTIIRSCPAVMK